MSLLEPRSSLNHESHHDQQDYDSNLRAEILGQITTLSPFLMQQLTQRLELHSKVLDQKKLLQTHMFSKKDSLNILGSPITMTSPVAVS